MQTLNQYTEVNREAKPKGKDLRLPISVPTRTYGYKLWQVTERTRLQLQTAEMIFLQRMGGLSLRDGVKGSEAENPFQLMSGLCI